MTHRVLLRAVLVLIAFAFQASAATQSEPESASGSTRKQAVSAQKFMVSAANPHATRAGYDVLRRGGSAVDAAIAVQLVLGLVEPQSSGIGGGGFLLHWDSAAKSLTSFDGRETAPAAAGEDLFLTADGKPMDRWDARVGGRSVGVPGAVRLLERVHKRYGRLPWKDLFQPAIELAEAGFRVSPRLFKLASTSKHLTRYAPARSYLFDGDGEPLPVGHLLTNRPYAESLRQIAEDGAAAFYRGAIAREIVATVRGAAGNPGAMTLEDMAAYEAKPREVICMPYRAHSICGMGPPSTGGLTIGLILGQLEKFDLRSLGANSRAAIHLFSQASRLAYADRNRYMGDPDAAPVPVKALTDRSYIAYRASLIDRDTDMGRAAPGDLPQQAGFSGDRTAEQPSTSHISVVDPKGNAVSFTTSIGIGFGARLMAGGFFLNNQLTDFAFRPRRNGIPHVNRAESGKRPRSSMSPTMVFGPDGGLRLIIGSPGGTSIITYVAKTIIAVLDWDLDVQSAINLPHFGNRNRKHTELERGTPVESLREALEDMGHKIKVRNFTSGLHGIEILPGRLVGGADPRREGIVLGD